MAATKPVADDIARGDMCLMMKDEDMSGMIGGNGGREDSEPTDRLWRSERAPGDVAVSAPVAVSCSGDNGLFKRSTT